jgi:ATP-binding cassette subfamily C protein
MMREVRAEAARAVRLALLLGGGATLLLFAAIWLKIEIYTLVIPTNSMPTAIGLGVGFLVIVTLLAALDHLRDLALLVAANRLARRLAGPAVLAIAARAGSPAAASAALLADVEAVRRGLAGPLCTTLLDAALVPAGLLLLWVVHPAFAALALLACALAALASLMAEREARRALRETNAQMAQTAGLVADAIRCAEAVEAMGLRPALARRWLAQLDRGGGELRRAQEAGRRMGAAAGLLQGIAAGGALLMGAWLSLGGAELGAGLMAAMLLTGRIVEPFARLGATAEDWGAASAAWRRLGQVLDRPAPPPGVVFGCVEGRLTLDRLTFLHSGTPRPLLREATVALEPGEVLGLTGAPGAGKTTLLRLMLGMERPTAGGAFLDGHATFGWDRVALAREIGFLPQDPLLGEGTVAEAIARLAPRPEMAAVVAAARLAGAEAMIAGLPLGYETQVGGSGEGRFSMGQRQRIALARAVFGQPRIVLLDEPTAWLDAEGEAAVLRMIHRLRAAGVAVVVSTHRAATLRAADRVLHLADGVLRPAGSAKVVPLGASRRGAA